MRDAIKIVSGGQTGADRAGLDAAISMNIPHGGHCPKGRLAEDGPIPDRYPLDETRSSIYAVRTKANVRDSDATVILTYGPPAGGSRLTHSLCTQNNRPCLLIDLKKTRAEKASSLLATFCRKHRPRGRTLTLNIAGSRESQAPGIYHAVRGIVIDAIKALAD